MATRKTKANQSTDDAGEPRKSSPETKEGVTGPFERAHSDYFTTALSAVNDSNLQQQITEAANDYLQTCYSGQLPQDVWLEMSEAWVQASARANSAPCSDQSAHATAFQEANTVCWKILDNANREHQERISEAYAHYADLAKGAPVAATKRTNEAFRHYVAEVCNTLSVTDVDTLTAEDLLAIGQSIVAVCYGQQFLNPSSTT